MDSGHNQCNPSSPVPGQPQLEPYNPYHSLPGARQTNEPISHFLQRLPPAEAESTIPPQHRPPWYWIANPRRSAYPTGRADTGDVATFTREGLALLQEFRHYAAQCGSHDDPRRTQLQELLRRRIGEVAKGCGVTTGKVRFPHFSLLPPALRVGWLGG